MDWTVLPALDVRTFQRWAWMELFGNTVFGHFKTVTLYDASLQKPPLLLNTIPVVQIGDLLWSYDTEHR